MGVIELQLLCGFRIKLAVGSLPTPHLNRKKLSRNSSWDFKYVLETMGDYWVGPDENFCQRVPELGGPKDG